MPVTSVYQSTNHSCRCIAEITPPLNSLQLFIYILQGKSASKWGGQDDAYHQTADATATHLHLRFASQATDWGSAAAQPHMSECHSVESILRIHSALDGWKIQFLVLMNCTLDHPWPFFLHESPPPRRLNWPHGRMVPVCSSLYHYLGAHNWSSFVYEAIHLKSLSVTSTYQIHGWMKHGND